MKKILVLDDNQTICLMLKAWISKEGYAVETANNVSDAKNIVRKNPVDLILSDIRMPDMDGFNFLEWVKRFDSDIVVIMMTSFADVNSALESMKLGTADYISKPIEPAILFEKIDAALKAVAAKHRASVADEALEVPPGTVYASFFREVNKFIDTKSHTLILGERGTGKSALGKYMFIKGYEATAPYIHFDPTNLQEQSIVSSSAVEITELEEAVKAAQGGILGIHHVDKASKAAQAILLSLITTQVKNNNFVQVVMSSDLSQKELELSLLPKLYATMEDKILCLPRLVDCKDSIAYFAKVFIRFANRELDKNIQEIDDTSISLLQDYEWPGNIQELKNTMVKLVLLANDKEIDSQFVMRVLQQNLQSSLWNGKKSKLIDSSLPTTDLRKENFEKEKIQEALTLARGNKTMAASILNVDRKTLYNKIKLYNLDAN